MSYLIPVFVVLALLVLFPSFIFLMLVRAVRDQGTRWWGIVILLSILTCYCTTLVAVVGLIVGGNATGSTKLERRYCEQFREVLTQTDTLPEAIARMDVLAASDEYQIREPDRSLRFRYVWILGGCFLFAGANLMMFAPGRREKRHPADCIVMIVAALVVFLTGVWQIAWGNGYAAEASLYLNTLAGWHKSLPPDELPVSNARIAAWLSPEPPIQPPKRLHELLGWIGGLYIEPEGPRGLPKLPPEDETEKPEEEAAPANDGTGPGIAIIGGADGPTAVFIGSELLKKQSGTPADRSAEKTNSQTENAASDL